MKVNNFKCNYYYRVGGNIYHHHTTQLAVTNLWELESETRHMQRAKATVRVRWGGY